LWGPPVQKPAAVRLAGAAQARLPRCLATHLAPTPQMTRGLLKTTLISLLQPSPEVVRLFEDLMLVADGAGARWGWVPACACVHA
jgi:hypothetical protein